MDIETVTIYYGSDGYLVNADEVKSYLDQGFTKKASKATSDADAEAAKVGSK